MPNPVAIQSYLKGISYPARKRDILDCAFHNEAPEDIIEVLETVSDREYRTPAELTREIGSNKHAIL